MLLFRHAIVAVAVFIVALGLMVFAALETFGRYYVGRAEKITETFFGSSNPGVSLSSARDLESVAEAWQKAKAFGLFVPQVYQGIGKTALARVSVAATPTDQVLQLCQALSNFQKATAMTPSSPRLHIAWADVESELVDADRVCQTLDSSWRTGLSTISAQQRLQVANSLAPHSVVDLHHAALVYTGIGQKAQALELFRHNAEINPFFSDEQRFYVQRLITSADDLQIALPRRFPSALRWVRDFHSERPAYLRKWNSTFERALVEATVNLEERFNRKELTNHQYTSFLESVAALPGMTTATRLNKLLDRQLAELYNARGNKAWAVVLAERAAQERIPVFKSVIANDHDPATTMLHSWRLDDSPGHSALDVLGRSLGVFVPAEYIPRLMFLENPGVASKVDITAIEIFASDDNQRFHRITRDVSITTHEVSGRQVVVVRLPSIASRFFKVHYAGAGRRATFSNSLQSLLQVYGRART